MSLSREELIRIVREELKPTLIEAFMELIPYVDEGDQEELEEVLGRPSDYAGRRGLVDHAYKSPSHRSARGW